MKILVACEFSGIVRDAFIAQGHDAMSCDLLPTDTPGPHHQCDVTEILNDGWDMMIAHPPCTYLSNSGVRWLYEKTGRWDDMETDAKFFHTLLNADIPKIAIENPIMHKYALNIIGQKHTQTVQPWQFGHPENKRTCLWLKGLSPLTETNNVKPQMANMTYAQKNKIHYASPGINRWKLRSMTFQGIADAMAQQWSK